MKEITKLMINEFKVKELGYDFMGYTLQKGDIYTFHHLIIPKRDGGLITRENGAILCGSSSHPYLHLIEHKDEEIFYRITSEMIDQNIKGCLDVKNLKKIKDLLLYFEREHCNDVGKKGNILIKKDYVENRFSWCLDKN